MDEAAKKDVERIKTQLKLVPHPSGYGYFKENWKADRQVAFVSKTSHSGPRAAGTSIYFLLTRPNCVQWHKHLSDEGFYWHAGGRVKVHVMKDNGDVTTTVLGDILRHDDCAGQVLVPHDMWYAAELCEDAQYSLYSAVVMPGFEFEDWIAGKSDELLNMFPQNKDIITRLS